MSGAGVLARILADDRLPAPSAVVSRLLTLTRSRDAALEEVAGVVALDPAIAARVMRTVNAARSGTGKCVTSVGEAVTRLGLRAVARIAIEVSLVDRHRSGLAEFDYGGFWSHSLARAVAAKVLATCSRRVPGDEAFTYGLLYSVGRLALVSVFPQAYRNLLRALGKTHVAEVAAAERNVFDVDAEELSAAMMKTWGLAALRDTMTNDGARDAATVAHDSALLQHCRTADLVARLMIGGVVTRDELACTMQAIAALGVGVEVVAEVFPDIIGAYHENGVDLQIRTCTAASLQEIYARAVDVPAAPGA